MLINILILENTRFVFTLRKPIFAASLNGDEGLLSLFDG
jgi:hypothetical protein